MFVFITRATLCQSGNSYGPVSVRLSVTSLSKETNGLIWFLARRLLSTSPSVCFKEIQVGPYPQNKVLPSGTFF